MELYIGEGPQFNQMNKTGTTATFKYNSEGLRVQKTVNGVVTNYTLHGKNIVHMTQGSNTLHFWYDASNRPAIVQFNGTKYAYIHNLQGDIVGILNTSGTEVVKYTYDAWGKVLSTTGSLASTLGTIQPFRYRGYVYDVETGLYYLRSRYYNPIWQRFVNADIVSFEFINNRVDNCFEYCYGNPIMYIDIDGLAGENFEIKHGWYFRIDPPSSDGKVQRHIHIWKKGGDSFAQNEDGTPHDGLSGDPPDWVTEEEKVVKKWEWKRPNSNPIPTPTPNTTPRPSPSPTPSPSPNPTPAPGPAPVALPMPAPTSKEEKSNSYSSVQVGAGDVIGSGAVIGLIWLMIKLSLAVPTGGLSVVIP